MLRPRSARLVAPLPAATLAVALLALAAPAAAQEAPHPQPAPQLAPLPPGQPPPTVVIQQPYPGPVYQQGPVYQGGPVYQAPPYQPGYPPPYYVQAPVQAQPGPSGPRVIHSWDEDQPIPPGYHKEDHVRRGLVIGGACLFGSTYLLSALVASIDADANSGSSNPAAALWIPAIGPFIQMTQTSSATADFALVIDGLAQLGGLAMFTIGLAAPKTELVRNDVGLQLKIAPVITREHSGMGLVGTF